MNRPSRFTVDFTTATVLALAAAGATAEEAAESGAYSPLGARLVATAPNLLAGAGGAVQAGIGYTSDDNYRFGEYNGLYEEGATFIGNLQWQDFSAGDSYWQVSLADVGLDTREGVATWGRPDRLKVTVGFDSQVQVRNDGGRTPFRGGSRQTLPEGWVSGATTAEFAALDESLRGFDQKLERDRVFAGLAMRLNDAWKLDANLSYEEKEGTYGTAGAIYPDASVGDAVFLAAPVDQAVTEFDLGLTFSGSRLQLEGRVGYSDFDNEEDGLTWQNPYSSYGPNVRYPAGIGGLATNPDSEQLNGRLTGQYIFGPSARLQFDGTYAVTEQDQNFLDYTVNPNLSVVEPLPRGNFDGELATGAVGAKLLIRATRDLGLDFYYRHRNRDYDTPRDGYRYVRGDASNQPPTALTVYNTAHDYRSDTFGVEAAYRLPLRSRLTFDYAYEYVERENAAVEETEEDRFTLGYRIQPLDNVSARVELLYGNRSADTYQWDQSYYALLDVDLINATPDNQRYTNHPELSQYYLSNREQWEGKLDFNWLPAERWNLALNLLWHEDDYDKSELGLTDASWQRFNLSATYAATDGLSATLYGGYDRFDSDQTSRAFRGGQEKNAFAAYPPLPQASDPGRNWDVDTEDTSITLGATLAWQLNEDLALDLDYSYVDTTSEQDFTTRSSTLVASDLPDVDTRLHHLVAGATWQMQENLSLRLDYQYYRYKSDDWARQGVQADTIGTVLTFGERNPNEQIHYVGASVVYRWQ